MDKKQFKSFCKTEFEKRGFKKQKNAFYLIGRDLLCGIDLQKSNYGDIYYVNYYFFIGDFTDIIKFPTHYESDIQERILVMSKKQTYKGNTFLTSLIEYTEYTEEELSFYFSNAFDENILPPIYQGKKYILDNLGKRYSLTLHKNEVLQKLKN